MAKNYLLTPTACNIYEIRTETLPTEVFSYMDHYTCFNTRYKNAIELEIIKFKDKMKNYWVISGGENIKFPQILQYVSLQKSSWTAKENIKIIPSNLITNKNTLDNWKQKYNYFDSKEKAEGLVKIYINFLHNIEKIITQNHNI